MVLARRDADRHSLAFHYCRALLGPASPSPDSDIAHVPVRHVEAGLQGVVSYPVRTHAGRTFLLYDELRETSAYSKERARDLEKILPGVESPVVCLASCPWGLQAAADRARARTVLERRMRMRIQARAEAEAFSAGPEVRQVAVVSTALGAPAW